MPSWHRTSTSSSEPPSRCSGSPSWTTATSSPTPRCTCGSSAGSRPSDRLKRRPRRRRLRRYAGLEPDFEPLATLATARIRERLDAPALLFPLRREVEKDLEDAAPLRKGIEQMIAPAGSEQDRAALEALLRQLEEYEAFVRAGVLPRAREDQRLPRDLYAHLLVSNGIEASPEELLELGREGLRETEAALQQAAGSIAARRNFPGSRWQDVLREIKRETIEPAQMTDHYTSRIAQLEEIVRKHDLVTMPSRGVRIRTTSDAESVADPVPHVDPAGLIAGGGELSFVIPLVADGRADEDFSFEAISWTVTAHEGRPGHELQMTAMKERGLSLARRLFALNAANVEGWAVYSEMLVAPFIPEEARFVGLHNLALRQARAYLDPALNLGQIQPDEALALLTSFGFSRSFAEKELDRYLFDTPGRDGAYYYGLLRMKELRAAAEKQLGPRFNLRRFHDAVLAQGALPFSLLTPAVLEDLSAEASPKRGPGL